MFKIIFKRFISIFLLTVLLMNVTQASSGNNLKAAFDELTFALTVDWDQKDQKFFQEQMEKFNSEIKDIPKEEVMGFLYSEVKNPEILALLKNLNSENSDEGNQQIIRMIKHSYMTGANWNAADVAGTIVGSAVTIYIIMGMLLYVSDPDGRSHWDWPVYLFSHHN